MNDDMRTPDEREIHALRAERDVLRDNARACAFSLAEDMAAAEIARLRALLSRAREALEPLGDQADAIDSWKRDIHPLTLIASSGWGAGSDREGYAMLRYLHARKAREVAQEIAKELGE